MNSIFIEKTIKCLEWCDKSLNEQQGIRLIVIEFCYLVIIFFTMPFWLAETLSPTKKRRRKNE